MEIPQESWKEFGIKDKHWIVKTNI
jgi:hypothetical protein